MKFEMKNYLFPKKSNILHARQPHETRTKFCFKLGNTVLPIVVQYKYIDIVITEFMDYNVVDQILADAANRAVINKYKIINGFGYYACFESDLHILISGGDHVVQALYQSYL